MMRYAQPAVVRLLYHCGHVFTKLLYITVQTKKNQSMKKIIEHDS